MDKEALKVFWDFIDERHNIYYQRTVKREPPPWTSDPILATNHFTNVYRDLDPGTVFAVEMLQHEGASVHERIFNALAYRLAFHEDSKRALGWLPIGREWRKHGAAIRAHLHELHKPFTPAYVVSNYGRKGPKVDVIMDVLGDIALALGPGGDWRYYPGKTNRAEFIAGLQMLYGIGPFVAFQATVDLCYPEVQALPYSNDSYALAGPGARKGIAVLWGSTANAATCDVRLAWLCRWHSEDSLLPYIDRANMQNCCCEFYKYWKIRNGTGKARRRFVANLSRWNDLRARGHLEQLEMPDV